VVDGRWSARIVVGADGVGSVARRQLGLAAQPAAHLGVALRGYTSVPTGCGLLDVRFVADRSGRGYGWCFTGGDGHANLGVGAFDATTGPRRRQLETLLRRLFPDVRVDSDSLIGQRLPLGSFRPAVGAGRVLLAGDAASLVDPLTGEGVHHALVSGMLAGRAAMLQPQTALATYRRALRRRVGRRLRTAGLMVRAAERPGLLEALFGATASDPALADAVAELMLGDGGSRRWLRVALAALQHGSAGREPTADRTRM
jgi:flavin-dependent dehydrogenase